MTAQVEVVRTPDGGFEWKVPLPPVELLRGKVLEMRHPDGPVAERWIPEGSGWWMNEFGDTSYDLADIVGRCIWGDGREGWELFALPADGEG